MSVDVALSCFTVVIGPMTLAFDDFIGHFFRIYTFFTGSFFLSDQYSCLIPVHLGVLHNVARVAADHPRDETH